MKLGGANSRPTIGENSTPAHNCSLIPVQRLRTRFLVGRDRWDGQAHLRSQIRGRVSVDFVRRCEIAEVLAGLQQDREQHAAGSPRALVRMKAKSVSLSLYRAAVRSMAVMRCPEKGSPKRLSEAYDLKEIGRSHSVSTKAYLSGRKRRPSKGHEGTRAALYLRVSTPDQKPDLQFDGLRAYAVRAGLAIIQDYCDVGVSGRREGRPQLNALMAAARNREIDCALVWKFDRFARSTSAIPSFFVAATALASSVNG